MSPRVLELFFLLLRVVMWQRAEVSGALVIEHGPASLNISVNGKATFRCVVSNAEVVLWLVNESNIDNVKNLVETQSVNKINDSSALEYHVFFGVDKSLTTQLNNSHIKCAGIDLYPQYLNDESDSALLTIQGVLDVPINITSDISTESFNLSWLPPFTFLGVDINWYQVNITARNSNDIVAQGTEISVYENITFPVIDNSTCIVYNASIQARTEAGLGNAGETDLVKNLEAPQKLEGSGIDIQLIYKMDNITLQYTITFQIVTIKEQDICACRQPDTINATVTYATYVTSSGNIPAEANDEGQITFELTLPKSAKGATVFTVITLTNRVGSTDSEAVGKTIVSVQHVAFTEKGSVVNIECYFSNFSDANGCYVVLECASDSSIGREFNLSTEGSSDISEIGQVNCMHISCAMYNVSAYDINDDGGIGAKAWSEMNKTLCPPLSITPGHISPSASMNPGPNNLERNILIPVLLGLPVMITIAGTVCIIFILIIRRRKDVTKQQPKLLEDCVSKHEDTHGQPAELLSSTPLDDEQ